jgi:hypothetical protein
MKIMATVPARAATFMAIRQPREVQYKLTAKRRWLRRFQHFIESTDWEERYLRNKVIDKISLGIIVISLLYFVPALGSIILR